ncbi:MAG: hypothetical protein Q9165_006583 [Trypethelium subeluteriae]
MDQRAQILPGLPVASPTTSHWQGPHEQFANLRSTDTLPPETDYIVIGSGISGTCGHTKAASYRSFPKHAEDLGIEEAVKIARLEYSNIKATQELAGRYGIQCSLQSCNTVDIIYDVTELEEGKRAIAMMQAALDPQEGAAQYTIYDAEEARKRFLAPGALGAFEYEAGSIHAYKFTHGILKLALQKGLNLQTNTPAISMTKLPTDNKRRWKIETIGGSILAQDVILAMNGYTAHLYPPLQGSIVPLRGQVTRQRLGSSLPLLSRTYSFIYAGGYEYMILNPHVRELIIGGGLGKLAAADPDAYLEEFGQSNDGKTNPWISEYLQRCTREYFGENWGVDDQVEGWEKEWTGIMGTSADGLPLIGPMPGEDGLWIQFACNGHGMVLCLKCAEGLTDMLLGEEDRSKEWFPGAFKITKERTEKRYTGRL